MSNRRDIVCFFVSNLETWVTWWDGMPGHSLKGRSIATAVRHFLESEGDYAEPGPYVLHCPTARADSGTLRLDIVWNPPMLVFPCDFCQQHGEIRVRGGRQVCPKCGGYKKVPV